MTIVEQVLNQAHQRAAENNIPDAGLVTPQEANALVEHAQEIVLVDVRSRAALELVCRVPFAILDNLAEQYKLGM